MISHYHTVLHYINLTILDENIQALKIQLQDTSDKLEFDKSIFNTYKTQLKYLYTKVDTLSQRLATFQSVRMKRGLINPLGSIIKSITGNLDHEDALRYDNAIDILENNNHNLMNSIKQHTTLSKKWVDDQALVISKLTKNQQQLQNATKIFEKKTNSNSDMIHMYIYLTQTFFILDDNMRDILNEIIKIENIVAFTSSHTVHHSILSLSDIKSLVRTLSSIYKAEHLPTLELREYYNIIRIGSYFSMERIVLVLQIPIVTSSSFDLYTLCPVPNKNNQVLIPLTPFIASNAKEFVYIEAECPKAGTFYICNENKEHQVTDKEDCIHSLIYEQKLIDSCKLTSVSLSKPALEQFDDRHYVVTFPKLTSLHLSCDEVEQQQLKGSYFVYLPQQCSLKTPDFIITNIEDKQKGQALKIMSLPQQQNMRIREKTLSLTSINLSQMHETQKQLSLQEEPSIQEIPKGDNTTIYHTTIPIYIIIIFAACLIGAVKYRKSRNKAPSQTLPETAETKKDAIFELDLSK